MLKRQGDVLLIPSTHPSFRKPSGKLAPVTSQVLGRVVLAYGEVTGHHHSLPVGTGTLNIDEGGLTFLTIEELTEVIHQEHAPIPLDPGMYEVRIGREWDEASEEIVQTRD